MQCVSVNIYGSNITCTNSYECEDNNMLCTPSNDCSIYCGNLGSCKHSIITAPSNGSLSVTCGGVDSCMNSTIYTQSDTNALYITADSNDALNTVIIYCPENGICSIVASGDGIRMMDNMVIYAFGFTDLYLSCNKCYTNTTRPSLYCLSDDSISCDIELYSGIDVWRCIDDTLLSICSSKDVLTDTPNTKNVVIAVIISFVASFFCCVAIAVCMYYIWKRSQKKRTDIGVVKSDSEVVIHITHNSPPPFVGPSFGKSARIDTEIALTRAAMKELPDEKDEDNDDSEVGDMVLVTPNVLQEEPEPQSD